MNTLCWLSASDLSRQLGVGGVTSAEVVNAVLDRARECEPRLRALYLTKPTSARAAADASDERWARHRPLSPLDGVPITLKENIYTVGDPAPIGTAAGSTEPKAVNAPIAERLQEAGVVVGPSDLEHVATVHGRWRVAPYLHLFFRAARWDGEAHAAEPEKSSGCAWVHPRDFSDELIPYEREALEAPRGAVLVLGEVRTA